MKLATTTGDFSVYDSQKERINHIYDAGFRYIDLSLYTPTEIGEFMQNDWEYKAKELLEYAKNKGVKFVQSHSPWGNYFDAQTSDYVVEKAIRSIEVSQVLGIPSIVVHMGFAPGMEKSEVFKKNKEFYGKLYPTMEKTGVNVLIENGTNASIPNTYFCTDGASMAEFLDYANHPLLHACWDTGHANHDTNQYESIKTMGKELFAVHINDNRGIYDEHMLPYMGTVSFGEIVSALLDIDFKGYFTFESNSSLLKPSHYLFGRHKFEKDIVYEPPLFAYDKLEGLMYELGEYILRAYNCFEE